MQACTQTCRQPSKQTRKRADMQASKHTGKQTCTDLDRQARQTSGQTDRCLHACMLACMLVCLHVCLPACPPSSGASHANVAMCCVPVWAQQHRTAVGASQNTRCVGVDTQLCFAMNVSALKLSGLPRGNDFHKHIHAIAKSDANNLKTSMPKKQILFYQFQIYCALMRGWG